MICNSFDFEQLGDWRVIPITRHFLSQSNNKTYAPDFFACVVSAERNSFASWLAHLLCVGKRNFYSFTLSWKWFCVTNTITLKMILEHCNLCVGVYCENSLSFSLLWLFLFVSTRYRWMHHRWSPVSRKIDLRQLPRLFRLCLRAWLYRRWHRL